MNNVFDIAVVNKLIERIQQLHANTQPKWGKMSVDQMLAHCNVTYEMAFENKHAKPSVLLQLILKLIVKETVVSDKPYKHSLKTAPAFIIQDAKNFEEERNRLIDYIKKTQVLGAAYFDGKASHSFGVLKKEEWNNMFYKHLDHHLSQFGV
jgi:hypothetical protein